MFFCRLLMTLFFKISNVLWINSEVSSIMRELAGRSLTGTDLYSLTPIQRALASARIVELASGSIGLILCMLGNCSCFYVCRLLTFIKINLSCFKKNSGTLSECQTV